MKKQNLAVNLKVSVKHKIGKGFKYNLGVFFFRVGTMLLNTKVKVLLENTEIGVIIPIKRK